MLVTPNLNGIINDEAVKVWDECCSSFQLLVALRGLMCDY